jgi:hypothetical protein
MDALGGPSRSRDGVVTLRYVINVTRGSVPSGERLKGSYRQSLVTGDLSIARQVLPVESDGASRVLPARAGCGVELAGSRPEQFGRLDDQRDDQGAFARTLGRKLSALLKQQTASSVERS